MHLGQTRLIWAKAGGSIRGIDANLYNLSSPEDLALYGQTLYVTGTVQDARARSHEQAWQSLVHKTTANHIWKAGL